MVAPSNFADPLCEWRLGNMLEESVLRARSGTSWESDEFRSSVRLVLPSRVQQRVPCAEKFDELLRCGRASLLKLTLALQQNAVVQVVASTHDLVRCLECLANHVFDVLSDAGEAHSRPQLRALFDGANVSRAAKMHLLISQSQDTLSDRDQHKAAVSAHDAACRVLADLGSGWLGLFAASSAYELSRFSQQVCANDLTSTGLLSASPSVPPGSPTPPPWILDSFWEFDKEPAAAATPRWRYACTLEYQSPAYGYTKAVSDVMSDALSYVAQGAQSSVEHVSWALGFSSVYLVLAVVSQQHVQISRVKDLLKMAAAHAQKVGSACAEDARKILDDAFLHSSGHTFYIPIVNRIEMPKLSEASRMVSKSETPPQTLRPTSSEKTRTRTRGQERMSSAARAQSEKMSPSERSQRASHAASVRASLSSSDVRRGRAVHAALVRHGKDDKDENSRTLVRHGKDEKDDNSRTLVRHGKDAKDENS